jgi:hypothetical protein
MADIVVKYNGVAINPAPIVSQSKQFIDYGQRWGEVTQITLNGLLTGLATTGDISKVTGVFGSQFGQLDVLDGTTPIYSWTNVVLDELSFGTNNFFIGSFAPYSAKLKAYNVPSGVVEPSNEYSFSAGDDGLVSVNHKIAAKGIKTSNGAFDNAVSFVKSFTGKNPFNPAFIVSGTPVLMSLSESIDRLNASYGVTEVWKYNTGSINPWIEMFSVSTNDTFENEYLTVDASMKLQASPIYKDLGYLESQLSGVSIPSRIQSLGFTTGLLSLNGFNVNRDSGANSVEFRASYVSGYSAADLSGYLDYNVSLSNDLLMPKENWRVEGEFVCRGPLNYRTAQLAAFKTANGTNWRNYLTTIISGSPLYTSYHSGANLFPWDSQVSIQENSGTANFRISLQTTDGMHSAGYVNPKYAVSVEPSKWAFDLLPSANIEGHYVLQDPQMMTKAKINLTLTAEAANASTSPFTGQMAGLSAAYVKAGSFQTSENLTTGINEISYAKTWLGVDTVGSGLLTTKAFGAATCNYLRASGYLFGY